MSGFCLREQLFPLGAGWPYGSSGCWVPRGWCFFGEGAGKGELLGPWGSDGWGLGARDLIYWTSDGALPVHSLCRVGLRFWRSGSVAEWHLLLCSQVTFCSLVNSSADLVSSDCRLQASETSPEWISAERVDQ